MTATLVTWVRQKLSVSFSSGSCRLCVYIFALSIVFLLQVVPCSPGGGGGGIIQNGTLVCIHVQKKGWMKSVYHSILVQYYSGTVLVCRKVVQYLGKQIFILNISNYILWIRYTNDSHTSKAKVSFSSGSCRLCILALSIVFLLQVVACSPQWGGGGVTQYGTLVRVHLQKKRQKG